jgi:hypothetical protein
MLHGLTMLLFKCGTVVTVGTVVFLVRQRQVVPSGVRKVRPLQTRISIYLARFVLRTTATPHIPQT